MEMCIALPTLAKLLEPQESTHKYAAGWQSVLLIPQNSKPWNSLIKML
jgi:hypothetical protein